MLLDRKACSEYKPQSRTVCGGTLRSAKWPSDSSTILPLGPSTLSIVHVLWRLGDLLTAHSCTEEGGLREEQRRSDGRHAATGAAWFRADVQTY